MALNGLIRAVKKLLTPSPWLDYCDIMSIFATSVVVAIHTPGGIFVCLTMLSQILSVSKFTVRCISRRWRRILLRFDVKELMRCQLMTSTLCSR